MNSEWALLSPQEHDTFSLVVAFLEDRLGEQQSIDWALTLEPTKRAERAALAFLLRRKLNGSLPEPWASAWRLVQRFWSTTPYLRDDGTAIYAIQERLQNGDRSGGLVEALVKLVEPRLDVKAHDAWHWKWVDRPKRARKVEHILSVSLTSGDLLSLDVLKLEDIDDTRFLTTLGNSLEASVVNGLDMAREIGWDGRSSFVGGSFLYRVHYTQPTPRHREDGEPDAYHRGIAPSVKLLNAVVQRLATIKPQQAQPFIHRWKLDQTHVFKRLWASMARSDALAKVDEVSAFIQQLDTKEFWALHSNPEFTELRTVRFNSLDDRSKRQLTKRLKKGPPASMWPRDVEREKVTNARLYWSVRELRRIQVAGGVLSKSAADWLEDRLPQFPDLSDLAIDDGFPEGPTVRSVPRQPDNRYNSLSGKARLIALETALKSSRSGWDYDDPGGANDWINQDGNALSILSDFEAVEGATNDFPEVWKRFGWAHKPLTGSDQSEKLEEQLEQSVRVLRLLDQLSFATLAQAIDGVSAWLSSWEKLIVKSDVFLPVWMRIWQVAEEVTNATPDDHEETDLGVSARSSNDDEEPMDLDTLNTPAGKLIGVFLAACPNLNQDRQVFGKGSPEQVLRDILANAHGRSGLIGKHRMIEALPYFLAADRQWAEVNLIAPLRGDDEEALPLWRALARRTHFTEVLEIIGPEMVERANDRRLGRETRRSLVFSLVIEALHALRERREPAVPNADIQQMLRLLDDEVRAWAADSVQRFVRDLSADGKRDKGQDASEQSSALSAADLFRQAAAPFLASVWPQEQSLATPGVSGALADLPATAGDAFAEAVDAITRFLVPFDCWSMLDYGLYGEEGTAKKIDVVDDEDKAKALLQLLDLTIGHAQGSVVPYDLATGLEHIGTISPALKRSPEFRRLSTASRR
ncbi:MAG: hypothetical protein KI785_03420 [Devosiaceae bacterium]|nr:hypothetical protein [Devosiaceae bacterium MH13]